MQNYSISKTKVLAKSIENWLKLKRKDTLYFLLLSCYSFT